MSNGLQQNNPRAQRFLLSLQRTAATVGRLTLTGAVSFGIGVLSMVERHNTYWNTTIFRVQTVDFNILSHTLPTKLSYTIIQNQPEELQRTLDSNYNLFGLVVTDASGKNIIAYSGKGSNREPSWISALEPERLQNYPYDVLLDPPPLLTQWNYNSPHAKERSAINSLSWGRFIGRVYYIRGVPPTFTDDFRKWLSNPFTGSSRFQLYNLTMLACLGGGLAFFYFWEHLVYKRRIQLREAKNRERFLVAQNQTVTLQLNERISQIERLQQLLEQERFDAKNYAEEIHHRNQQLQQKIFQLQGTISSLPTVAVLQTKEVELKQANREAELAKQSQENLKTEIQQLNWILQEYQDKFRDAQEQKAEQDQLQRKIIETEEACFQAELELEKYAVSEQNLQETIADLKLQIISQQDLEGNYIKQLELLQSSLTESQQRENKFKEKIERTEQQLEFLSVELDLLKEEMPRDTLNGFEKSILEYLKLKFKNQKIFTNYDTSFGQNNSKIADFIIVFQSCIIVIEAKGHQGNIEAIGDIRNTEWICNNGKQKHIINSCWGRNPYYQIKTYIDSLSSKINYLKTNPKNKIFIYGIIVFPSEAQISQEIASNIGKYYQVTTLVNLEEVIQSIENKAKAKNRSGISYHQVVELLEDRVDNHSFHRNVA